MSRNPRPVPQPRTGISRLPRRYFHGLQASNPATGVRNLNYKLTRFGQQPVKPRPLFHDPSSTHSETVRGLFASQTLLNQHSSPSLHRTVEVTRLSVPSGRGTKLLHSNFSFSKTGTMNRSNMHTNIPVTQKEIRFQHYLIGMKTTGR
jgi:hypothetical protein